MQCNRKGTSHAVSLITRCEDGTVIGTVLSDQPGLCIGSRHEATKATT